MFSKRYESTEVYLRTWLHVPSETLWSTSSGTHQGVEILKEQSTKMYTSFYEYEYPMDIPPLLSMSVKIARHHWGGGGMRF